MSPELVVERDKLESLLPLLGAELDEEGHIVDVETGEIVPSPSGEKLTIEEMGYLGHGSLEPVENDFSSIVSYLSDRDSRKQAED